ncbi:T-cell surface glycoprotein CD3 gamma chain-like [Elgaria multicarinata webbii]|uniref:T-cell surface glycoprotein CD3 gamma chain-like n=1 Tax=Elgaria multicarinata webbii TaxID=159646 RepID=UPI002FCCB971
MGGGHCLLCAMVLGLFFKGIITAGEDGSKKGGSIKVNQDGKIIILECENNPPMINWEKDGMDLSHSETQLRLGSVMDDPRGVYQCVNGSKTTLQVYVRMCQNCIEWNLPTIIGLTLASLVATSFLGVAVYCIGAEESGQRSRASDKQTLLANDQLYQPLGERNNGQYSHIGVAKSRHR